MLSTKNSHPRDGRIRFEEGCHKYYVDGSKNGDEYTSTTRMVHSMFKPFDADEVIDKMRRSKTWNSSKYFGLTSDEIKSAWDTTRHVAAKSGTEMHKNIEAFFNNEKTPSSELDHFYRFVEDHKYLEPYRTEWCIFDEDSRVCGSVDMVYKDTRNPGCFVVVDWKRSKAIKTENKWQSGTSEHSYRLPDCNFSHYSLQLETYKYILEKKYGLNVTETFIVVLHPSQDSYIKMQTRDCSEEVESIMKKRSRHSQQSSPEK